MKISKLNYFIIGVVVLILIGVFWWTQKGVPDFVVQQNNNQQNQTSWRCLEENEKAEYKIKGQGSIGGNVMVSIMDKEEITNFQIGTVFKKHLPVELYKCGIYVIRLFNYKLNTAQQGPNSRAELWKYDYNGKGVKVILLNKKNERGQYISNYNSTFKVSPSEKYVILDRGYLGKDDYALIVKDLNTKQDVFALPYQSIFEKNPKFLGAFGMREWTKDSRYFWADIFEAAKVNGFVRIDTKKWKYELYKVPEGLMGGEKLNTETGWITYHTDLVWSGMHDVQGEIKQERREQGLGTKFYLYNLFSQKKILVYETQEPLFFTEPKWISDNEIEYRVESGERKNFRF